MRKQEKVDVLVATYNTEKEVLKKQLDSILNQSYEDINILISDDNSRQETLDVLKEYEKLNNVTIFYQKKNLGYIKNFEYLLEKSNANYICFCDHDDIWNKYKVEKELNAIKKTNADLVYCNSNQIDENDREIRKDYLRYKNIPIVNGKSKIANVRYIGNGCSQMFTKKVKEKMLPFKKSVVSHDFLASFIANQENGIYCIDENLFSYRLHSSNVFGGRSLNQNIRKFKEKNSSTYSSFLKYRSEDVIKKAYLNNAYMCLDYCTDEKTKEHLKKIIAYYENLLKTKYINLNIIKYFKLIHNKQLIKQEIKEIAIFHFPVISYIKFLKG